MLRRAKLIWFDYELMREFGNRRRIAAAKAILLYCGAKIYLYDKGWDLIPDEKPASGEVVTFRQEFIQ